MRKRLNEREIDKIIHDSWGRICELYDKKNQIYFYKKDK